MAIEISRLLWKNEQYVEAYKRWIALVRDRFYALHKIEAALFLGLCSFAHWQSGGRDDHRGNVVKESDSDEYESDEWESEDSVESSASIPSPTATKEPSKGPEIERFSFLDAELPPVNWDQIDDEKEARVVIGDLFRHYKRVKNTPFASRQLDPKQKKAQRQLLQIDTDSAHHHNVSFFRAREFFRLALAWEPSNETALAHLLQVRVHLK